uniref:Uncharacterized protein n=1 Tax=Candidatus Kentrum sp. LFY TaxID=2126342 RepID=A0A450WDZ9_9GAMM|nr:MAG: hypothetical protein BECKLFY1418C_GA0070996_10146 [Candidatus Kentron sp. LFY]
MQMLSRPCASGGSVLSRHILTRRGRETKALRYRAAACREYPTKRHDNARENSVRKTMLPARRRASWRSSWRYRKNKDSERTGARAWTHSASVLGRGADLLISGSFSQMGRVLRNAGSTGSRVSAWEHGSRELQKRFLRLGISGKVFLDYAAFQNSIHL